MAEIRPFKGLFYNKDKIEISKVVAPPYDIIDRESRDYYYSLSPYNVVRLILNKSKSPYENAGKILQYWIRNNILISEKKESFYLYRQEFYYRKRLFYRYGVITLLKLEEPGSDILPHERTYETPKRDRFKLLQKVQANLSPIFIIFSDRKKQLLNIFSDWSKNETRFDFTFENIHHTLWVIENREVIENIRRIFQGRSILIADGHHRYEVALNYRNLIREKNPFVQDMPYDYVMSYLAPIEQEGMLVLPTHRLINLPYSETEIKEKLTRFFELTEYNNKKDLFNALLLTGLCSFGFSYGDRFYLLKIKSEARDKCQIDSQPLSKLDVTILHDFILKEIFNYRGDIYYTQDENEALKYIEKGRYNTAIFLRPTPMDEILNIAEKKLLMPQKSTYFYPKILTGLVFYKF